MAPTIVVLSGQVGAGKTTLAQALCDRYNGHIVSTHHLLRNHLGAKVPDERGALQVAGERLDRRTGGKWVCQQAQPIIAGLQEDALVVIDSVRIKGQLDALRDAHGATVLHVHLTATLDVLRARYGKRRPPGGFTELASYVGTAV